MCKFHIGAARMSELKDVLESVQSIKEEINKIHNEQIHIGVRLQSLEGHSGQETREFRSNQDPSAASATPTVPAVSSADVQREYETVKELYSKVQIPQELKVLDSRVGIKRAESGALNILSKSARFTETAIKILKDSDGNLDESHTAHLFSVLVAHITSLKSEYANLLVQSTFDEKVSKLYKTLDNHGATFSQQQLTTLRSAIDLESARPKEAAYGRGRSTFRAQGWRGRYRGQFQRFTGGAMPRHPSPNEGEY